MIFVICSRIKRSCAVRRERAGLARPAALIAALCASSGPIAGCGFHLQGTNGALPEATAQTYLLTEDPYSEF